MAPRSENWTKNCCFIWNPGEMSEEAVYEMMARARIDAIAGKIPDAGMREKIRAYLGDVQDEEK